MQLQPRRPIAATMPRAASWTVTLTAVAFAKPAPLKLQLRRPPTGRAAAIAVRGGSYDETYDDDWSGEEVEVVEVVKLVEEVEVEVEEVVEVEVATFLRKSPP